MTFYSDDMTIVARLKQDRQRPRERAQEERRTRKQTREYKKRLVTLRRLRHARRLRSHMKARKRKGGPSFIKRAKAAKAAGKGMAVKGGVRLIPVLGWAILLADVITIGHEVGRRFEGKSGRLVEAEDAHVVMGDLDEKAQANADALGFVEGDADLLRATGQDGKMSGTLKGTVGTIKRLALERAMGADMIRRDPHFDSKDSFLDKMIAAVDEKELRQMSDRTAHLIRTERGIGKGK